MNLKAQAKASSKIKQDWTRGGTQRSAADRKELEAEELSTQRTPIPWRVGSLAASGNFE